VSTLPIVGITTYARDERGRFHLPAEYVTAIRRAGAVPCLIPPGEAHWRELFERVDGLLFTGGGDVDPARYGGKPHPAIYGVDRERDEGEIALARAAVETLKPTLAICRGLQLVNVALGGTLVEHLPDEVGEEVAHRGEGAGTRAFHPVAVQRRSKLAKILAKELVEPSSSHHQAARRLGEGLEVVARAADDVVEALELRKHPFFVAVQWHPEHTAETDPLQQGLFDAFVAACAAARKA
jgi:putative glutamine amidotransferase